MSVYFLFAVCPQITFVVPAVIICSMLLLAGIVACVLYRRRRTGKMSVGDEDERQSFRNKGIPVIFQVKYYDQVFAVSILSVHSWDHHCGFSLLRMNWRTNQSL